MTLRSNMNIPSPLMHDVDYFLAGLAEMFQDGSRFLAGFIPPCKRRLGGIKVESLDIDQYKGSFGNIVRRLFCLLGLQFPGDGEANYQKQNRFFHGRKISFLQNKQFSLRELKTDLAVLILYRAFAIPVHITGGIHYQGHCCE